MIKERAEHPRFVESPEEITRKYNKLSLENQRKVDEAHAALNAKTQREKEEALRRALVEGIASGHGKLPASRDTALSKEELRANLQRAVEGVLEDLKSEEYQREKQSFREPGKDEEIAA